MPGLSKQQKRVQRRAAREPAPARNPERNIRFPWLSSLMAALNWWFALPITSYSALVLLQLKMVWGMWWFKDLTSGDTTQYFLEAVRWFETGRNSFWWSPMYTTFYGSLLYLSSDPYTVTILHRLIIVFASAILVLALMRRLLPAGSAWMAAAWWVVLPINFNALYEVHLFAVIPLLLAVLVVLWIPGPRGRGMGAALLLLTGMLMRNEYVVATVLFLSLSLGWDLFRSRAAGSELKRIAMAYGWPILAAGLISLVLYVRSSPPASAASLRSKQTLNVCQVFAAGYEQRESDFQGSPWTECDQLMNRFFGSADLTFPEALRRNPAAMLQHVLWNLRLTPSGLQVLLFNYRSGPANPDYAPTSESSLVLIPSLAACATVAAGLILLFRERKRWRSELTEQRMWGWISMACMSVSVGAAMLSNRPRPSYMFILGIALRAATAFCFYVIVSRWPKVRSVGAVASVALVGLALYLPAVYDLQPIGRPILTAYRRVQHASSAFAEHKPLLVSTEFGTELTVYAGRCNCPTMRFDQLRKEVVPGVTLAQALDQNGANLFYADELILRDPLAQEFLDQAASYHWRVVAERHALGENWAVFQKNR